MFAPVIGAAYTMTSKREAHWSEQTKAQNTEKGMYVGLKQPRGDGGALRDSGPSGCEGDMQVGLVGLLTGTVSGKCTWHALIHSSQAFQFCRLNTGDQNMAGRFLRKVCSHIHVALPLKHSSTILIPRTTSAFLPKNVCLRMAGTSSSKAKEKREM